MADLRNFYENLTQHVELTNDQGQALDFVGFQRAMRDGQKRRTLFDAASQTVDLGEWDNFDTKMSERLKDYTPEGKRIGVDPTIGRFVSGTGSFVQSFTGALAGVPESVGILYQRLAGEDPRDPNFLMRFGEDIRRAAADMFPTNPEYQEEFITSTLAGGAGSLTAFFAGGMLGKGLKISAGLVSAALGGAALSADEYRSALKKTGDDDKAWQAWLANLPIGATEAVPVGKALNRIDRWTGGTGKKVLRGGLKGGLEEFIQEVAQQFLTNSAAQKIYDAERKVLEGVGEGGAAGFILGMFANALGLSAKRLGDKVETYGRQPTEEEALRAQGTTDDDVAKERLRQAVRDRIGTSTTGGEFESEVAVAVLEGLSQYTGQDMFDLVEVGRRADGEGQLQQVEGKREEYPTFRLKLKDFLAQNEKQKAWTRDQLLGALKKFGVKQAEMDMLGINEDIEPKVFRETLEAMVNIGTTLHDHTEEVKLKRQRGEIVGRQNTFEDYSLPGPKGVYKELFVTSPESKDSWVDGHKPYDYIKNPIVRLRTSERVSKGGEKLLFLEELQPPSSATQPGRDKSNFERMPEYYQRNWMEIGLKQLVRYAAENGYKAIGWTTGEQQVARYGLAGNYEIHYREEPTIGNYLTVETPQGQDISVDVASIQDANEWIKANLNEEVDLAEVATKEQVGAETRYSYTLSKTQHGLAKIYDEVLPRSFKKVFGKGRYGNPKVEMSRFGSVGQEVIRLPFPDTYAELEGLPYTFGSVLYSNEDIVRDRVRSDWPFLEANSVTISGTLMGDRMKYDLYFFKDEGRVNRRIENVEVVNEGVVREYLGSQFDTYNLNSAEVQDALQSGRHLTFNFEPTLSNINALIEAAFASPTKIQDSTIMRLEHNDGSGAEFVSSEEIGKFEEEVFETREIAQLYEVSLPRELRFSALAEGFNLFQGEKGSISFYEDGRAFISLGQKSDVTTIIHEFAHFGRRHLTEADQEIANNFVGAESAAWTVEQEEEFARAFEAWVGQGKTSNPKLKPLFAKLRDLFIKIYRAIIDSPLDIEFSPAMEALFDRMVGGYDLMGKEEQLAWARSQVDEAYWINQLYGEDQEGRAQVDGGREGTMAAAGADPEVLVRTLNQSGDITYKKVQSIGWFSQTFKFPLKVLHDLRKKSSDPTRPSYAEQSSFALIAAQLNLQHRVKELEAWYQKLRPGKLFGVFGRKSAAETEKQTVRAMELYYLIRDDGTNEVTRVQAKADLAKLYAEYPMLQKIMDGVDERGGIVQIFEHLKERYKESLRRQYEIGLGVNGQDLSPADVKVFQEAALQGRSPLEAMQRNLDIEAIAKERFIEAAQKPTAKRKKGLSYAEAEKLWNEGGEKVTKVIQATREKEFKRLKEVVDGYTNVDSWGIRDYISKIELGNYVILDSQGKKYGFGRTAAEAKRKAKQRRDELIEAGEDPGPLTVEAQVSRINPTAARHDVLKGEDNIFEVLPRYTYAMEKRIVTGPVLAQIDVWKKQHPEEFSPDIVAVLNDQKKELMGDNYTFLDRIFDDISQAFGWEFGKARKATARARWLTANLKLGYRPVAAIVNAVAGFGNTYVKVGTDAYLKARDAVQTGVYTAPDGEVVNIHDRLAELEEDGRLGLDFAVDATGEINTRTPLWKPMGLFQKPEVPVRKHSWVANYILQRERYGLSDADATWQAIENLWFQQCTYNLAAIPKILRSPTGQVIGQFKSFFVNHLQFIASLRGWEIPRYIGVSLILGGPRGAIYFLKSLPVLLALGMDDELDKVEKWIVSSDNPAAMASRGVAGLFGADISAPATFQFPHQAEDWLGPFMKDALGFYKNVFAPAVDAAIEQVTEGDPQDRPGFIYDRFIEWGKMLMPALYYWNQIMDSVLLEETEGPIYQRLWEDFQKPNIWIRDSKGYKAYQIGGAQDRILLSLGAQPIPLSDYNLHKKILRDAMEQRKDNRYRLLNRITNKLIENRPLDADDFLDIELYGINPQSIPTAVQWKEMPPEARQIWRQSIVDRMDAVDFFGL